MITKEMKDRYREYLKSTEWKELKLDLLQKRGCSCERCKRPFPPNKLQVHHKTYERLYEERELDLELLCGKCHKEEHGIKSKSKKPKTQKQRNNKQKTRKTPKQIYEKSLKRIKGRFDRGRYNRDTYERCLRQAATKYSNAMLNGVK